MSPEPREKRLVATFVTLADTLVAGFDVVEMLQTLIDNSTSLFGAVQAGIMLADEDGGLSVIASTSEDNGLVALMQLPSGDGPCVESYAAGEAISVIDVRGADARWPGFEAVAAGHGIRALYGVPLRLRSNVIGTMCLFFGEPRELSAEDASAVQGLADVATIGILQERAHREQSNAREQLQNALNSRVVIEQAKGVIAQLKGWDMDSAFRLLRDYARSNNLALRDVAELVVTRRLTL